MSRWRYLVDDAVEADVGLAEDEFLMAAYGDGSPPRPPTLRLYTYRSHCALVGRFQNVPAEVDTAACARSGIAVGRRPTGGGAIVMGEGQLGVAVVTSSRYAETPAGAVNACRFYAGGVVAGLRELGVDAAFRPRNDVEVGGRKIAGTGICYDDRGALLFHASVLCDLDVPLMLRVLRIPAQKIGDKAIASVEDRITTLCRELGRAIPAGEAREAVRRGFERALGLELVPEELTAEERRGVEALAASRYRTRSWIEDRRPEPAGPARLGEPLGPPDAQAESLAKTEAGLLRIYIALSGQVIKSVLITGDYFATTRAVADIEARLKWVALDRDGIARIVRVAYDAGEGIAALSPERLADAVWEAGQAALREGALSAG